MRSKANIKGHPLHPILVSFPIALLTGALLLDALHLLSGNDTYTKASLIAVGAGLISGLIAAVPGAIDYFFTVPPQSSAKERATKHALINIGMLFLFSVIFAMKMKAFSLAVIMPVEIIAVTMIGIAGWMGGTLITRNQIGVDHRYAHAGKWSSITINTNETKIELKDLGEMKPDQMKLFIVNGKRIVIAKTVTSICAFEDRCTHRGGSLADGVLICGTVQCPWHGSQFAIATGEVKAGPATGKIKVYKVTEENRKYFLEF